MKKFFTCLLFSFFSFFIWENAHATHIVGGEMTYVCNATGNYTVTLILYRDCDGIPFTVPVDLKVYNHANGALTTYSLGAATDLEFIFDDYDNPCATIPPGNCVEKGTFVFEDVIIPLSTTNFVELYYHTTALSDDYIDNVFNADGTGITINAIIPPLTTSTCHSSPTFDSDPPLVICLDQPMTLDLSVTPSNSSNTIEYEFFTPYTDAPQAAPYAWDVTTNNFDTIVWETGYTAEQSFGANTNLVLTPNGNMTGDPNQSLHYYNGVQVREYDSNGDLLSVISRTFTYIVVDCNINTANIGLSADPECGSLEVSFLNQSSNSNGFLWTFGDTAALVDSSLVEDPIFTFTDFGEYTVTLISYADDIECADTAKVVIDLYEPVTGSILSVNPQCLSANSFNFNGTVDDPNLPTSVLWDFGPNATPQSSTDISPSGIVFDAAGNHQVDMHIYYKDCDYVVSTIVNVFDGLLDEVSGPDHACTPELVTFQGANSNPQYEYTWYIDGDTIPGNPIEYFFEESGFYDVDLYVYDPSNGCESFQENPDFIKVFPTPLADFKISDDAFTVGEQFQMWDNSVESEGMSYTFSNGFYTEIDDPFYVFTEPGQYTITQNVNNGLCVDKTSVVIDVSPRTPIIPNVFSPNGDHTNDYFYINTFHNENVQVNIFDRWGAKVFAAEDYELCDPVTGEYCWDGYNQTTEKKCKKGTYFYIVKLKTGESYKGTFNIF
jgi:gliding motility-associated-like protein